MIISFPNMKYKVLILLIILSKSAIANNIQKTDSTRTGIFNNKVCVIHKVSSGETFYGLIKKYNCTIADAFSLNPSLNNLTTIKIGQDLKFPLKRNSKTMEAKVQKKEIVKKNNGDEIDLIKSKTLEKKINLHIVVVGETIYSISKLYELEMIDLVEANRITENKISIGQSLIVDKNEIFKLLKGNANKIPKEYQFTPTIKGLIVSEQGVAEVINTTNRSRNYLALHKTAAVGTIIKVTNEATGASINAKVVGKINAKGPDQELLIKLSPFAFYQLKPKDSKIRAKVEYFKSSTL